MRTSLLKGLLYLACCVVIFGIIGCEESMQRSMGDETHYLKYNFHYTTEKGKAKGSIANYTSLPDHKILPYGSSVKVTRSRSGFALIDEDSGRKLDVLAPSKYLAGKSLSDYLNLILSKTPVSYMDLSEIDRKGISEGRPYKGMSKNGVMIALGYPAPHRTASPDADVWYYWRNRFAYYAVNFENGIVASNGY